MSKARTVLIVFLVVVIVATFILSGCAIFGRRGRKKCEEPGAYRNIEILKDDCKNVTIKYEQCKAGRFGRYFWDIQTRSNIPKIAAKNISDGPKGECRICDWAMYVREEKDKAIYILYHCDKPKRGGLVKGEWKEKKRWTIPIGKVLPDPDKCKVCEDYYILKEPDGTHKLYHCALPDGSKKRKWVLVGTCIEEKEEKEYTSSFRIEGPNSVPFELFNVLKAGSIQVEVSWTGASETLKIELTGRRRPDLEDPAALYNEASGTSPLTLSYDVTDDDLARGVGWRLAIYDLHGSGDAEGTIRIRVPFDLELSKLFRREKISLRSGDLWPSNTLQAQFLASLAAASGEGLHCIISLNRPLTCEENWHFQRQGIFRQSFLPGRHSFGIVYKGADLTLPAIAGPLRAITPLEPEDKVDPHILLGNYSRYIVTPLEEPSQNYVLNDDGTLELSILFAEDTSRDRIGAILAAEAISSAAITDSLWQGTFASGKVAILAAYDEVEWIEAGPEPRLYDNDDTRPFINVDAVQDPQLDPMGNLVLVGGFPNYQGLTGTGITVGIDDSGIDAGHPDLNVVATINPSVPAGSHGTHVAGIAAASGFQSNQNNVVGNPNGGTPFQWRGMAPEAGLVDSSNLINAANLLNAIQNSSLDVANHSHMVGIDGNYNAGNRTVDQEIRGGTSSGGTTLLRRPQVYSAGNAGANNRAVQGGRQRGYFSLNKQLKNGIIVGNWDARPGINRLSQGSSMGPAHDGRIKPDVVAPGTLITSTGTMGDGACYNAPTNNSNGYAGCSGTSMSAPAVSGILALLLQGWQDTYSTPSGTTIDDSAPFPSTLRALVIHTATDIVNANVRGVACADVDSDSDPTNPPPPINGNDGMGNATATAGPDFATGWGQVNAEAAVELAQDARIVYRLPVPNRIIQDAVNQNGIREYDFVVAAADAVRVTLAWDDVEGALQNPATNPVLVNDLDLELEAPDGTIFYPWQLGQDILDSGGNPLADNAQPPGTNIQVDIPIPPTATTAATNDYVPAEALDADGVDDDWVAGQGKDHLNNVEQVFVQNVAPGQIGHWILRVIGFEVTSGAQDFSVVGFPYPDLAELEVSCTDRVGLSGFGQNITFTWTVSNTGPIASGGAGDTFQYQILLSKDFYLGNDVVLTDSAQAPLGPLADGASVQHTSTVQITQAQADTLLGVTGASIQDLEDEDVFLIINVDSGNDVLEHNEINIAFVQLARLVDVVLVLDRSGSMDGSVPVSSGSRRKIDVLMSSANLFLDLIRLDAGDRLAEVSFAGNLGANSITTDFGPTGLTAIGTGNIGDARSAINALNPDGATDIHGALQQGVSVMTAVGSTDHRRVLIFFSDGEKTTGLEPTDPGLLGQFTAHSIHVYSVGFGTEGGTGYSSIDVELLQTLANAGGGGFFHVTESAASLDKFFVNAVAGATRNDIIFDPIDDIAPGQTHTIEVILNEQDANITFILTWDSDVLGLDLSVRSPSGLIINASNASLFGDRISLINRPTYKIMKIHFPVSNGPSEEHDGTWQMLVGNPATSPSTVRYSASAIGESTIHVNISPPGPSGGGFFAPGAAIPLQVAVCKNGGVPVTTAVVTVSPNVPLVGLGDLLSSVAITMSDLSGIPDIINGEPLSLPERIVLLLQERYGGNPLPRADGESFELAHETEPGDFTGDFTATSTEGVYNFTVRVNGLVDCQKFQRETSQSVTVSTGTDPDESVIIIEPDPVDPGGTVVTVTPGTTDGGYVGPGVASGVQIDGGGILVATSEVMDNLDGSYSQNFRIQSQGVADLKIQVLGVDLPSIKLDTRMPAPVDVYPPAGRNDTDQMITVTVSQDADLSQVAGISLALGTQSISLGEFSTNPDERTVQGLVPAELQPGLYMVYLDSNEGRGITSQNAVFRVIGRGQNFPESVNALSRELNGLLAASDNAEGIIHLGGILRSLRATPTGDNLDEETRLAAVNEATRLLMKGKGQVESSDIGAIISAVNSSKIDARHAPSKPVSTSKGEEVQVALGNGVSVTFGLVATPGETTVVIVPGPMEFPDHRRGAVHVVYEITTTAEFRPTAGVDVEIEYEEGDFEDESSLRLYSFEDKGWIDRTVEVDTKTNRIRARVSNLNRFVILSAE